MQIRRVGASVQPANFASVQRAQRLDAHVPAEAPPPQAAPARSWRAGPVEATPAPYRADRTFSARDEMESRLQASTIAAMQQMPRVNGDVRTTSTQAVAGAADVRASVTRKLSLAENGIARGGGGGRSVSEEPDAPPSSGERPSGPPPREGVLSILQGFL